MLIFITFILYTIFVALYSWWKLRKDNLKSQDGMKLIITDNPENSYLEITLDDAIKLNENNQGKQIGDEVFQP